MQIQKLKNEYVAGLFDGEGWIRINKQTKEIK